MREQILKPVLIALLILANQPSQAQQPPTATQDFDQAAAQAEQARNAHRIEEAVELYRKALALRPRWDEGWFNLGTLLYDRDVYAEAAQAFKEATTLNHKVGTAWAMLGLSEFKLGRYDDALTHLRQARKLGISGDANLNQVVSYHEGLLLLNKADFEGAQRTLGSVSKQGAESKELIIALGLSVLRVRPSELTKIDETARAAVPRAGWAEHLAAQKKLSEAASDYEKLTVDFPKTPNVQLAYGRYLRDNGELEKAAVVLQRELANDPRHLLARLLIADTKLRLKDYAAGIPHAEEAIKLRPQLPLGHYLLGSLLLGTGNTTRAITELETARAGEPNDSKIYYALGTAYARVNRKQDAERARADFVRLSKEEEAAANQ